MKRLLQISVLMILIGLSAIGCAKNSIVGKWSGSVSLPGGRGSVNATIEYKPDGTQITTITQGPITVLVNEKYTIKDDTITETVASISMAGRDVPIPASSKNPQTAHYTIDGDTLKLTNARTSQVVTLTRVKS